MQRSRSFTSTLAERQRERGAGQPLMRCVHKSDQLEVEPGSHDYDERHLRLLTLPRSWRLLRPRTSSTVALACHHIQSHASKSLCLVTLDEVVGRTPCHWCTHRPRKASTKRGNYRRTTFLLGPPPPQVHP